MSLDVIDHLIDIKERLSKIESGVSKVSEDLDKHAEASQKTRNEVEALKLQVVESEAKTDATIKTLKVIGGVISFILTIIHIMNYFKR